MTPQRSVATVSHHRNASRSTAAPAACSYADRKLSTLPSPPAPSALGRAEPPGPDAEPGQVLVDLSGVHQFPVQDGGQPGGVDDQVAHPEITVHQNPRRRRWPVSGQPAKRPLEGRRGIAHLVEAVTPLAELIGLCQADALGVGAVDGGKRLGALPQQPLATGIVEAAVDSSDDRLAADGITDEVRIAECGRGIVRGQDVGDRCTGGGRPLLHTRLQLHTRMPPPSSGGPVRRISARRMPSPTASNDHVVRLAPPVKAHRFSMPTPSPSTGSSTVASAALRSSADRAPRVRVVTCARSRRVSGRRGGSGSPQRPR